MPFCSGPHALRRPVAIAGAVVKGGAAVLIASRLIFRDQEDLGIGDSGNVKLIVAAIALAALAAGLAGAGRSSAEEESIE